MSNKTYDADSIQVIRQDRDRIRKRPTIYIPDTGVAGAVHVIFEGIDNGIDEITAKGSIGDTVTAMFDLKTKEVTIIDNGRGIPHEKMLDVCTVINSSGKYDNSEDSAYQYSGGTNGVGMKLAVYLSDYCIITSMRDKKKLMYKFEDGLKVDEELTSCKANEHGTIITFKLAKRFLDIKHITKEMIYDRYYEKSFLFPNVKLNLIFTNDSKSESSYMFTGKNIVDRVLMFEPDTVVTRVTETRNVTVLDKLTDDKLTEKKVKVDVAFAYKEDALDNYNQDYIISYGNTIKTYTGGAHVDGLKDGIVKYIKKIVPTMSKRDQELQFTPSDITAGLCGFVVAEVSTPEFRGQYKDQLSNQEVKFAVRDAVYDALDNEKKSVIDSYVSFIRNVAKGRIASKKVRKKDVSNAFSKDRIKKYMPISETCDTVAPELILVEGDSAAGAVNTHRDIYNQAVYSIKKPKNIFDDESNDVNTLKTVFNDILDICGIQAGNKCDPSKSYMKHIWALTDADVDGDAIAIAAISLLAKHCKPMVDAGMVGRILPPAYSYKKNDNTVFVKSQREFFKSLLKRFVKHVEITKDGKPLVKDALIKFLVTNYEYTKMLTTLANRYSCDPKLLEYIIKNYHDTKECLTTAYWGKVLAKYDGLVVEKDKSNIFIKGLYKNECISITLNKFFDNSIKKFKEYQNRNITINGFTVNGKGDKTVYDVMKEFDAYRPNHVTRFKGLGELNPEDLRDLCLDKNNRQVVIFKFDDIATDMNKINVIMSSSSEYKKARNDIMQQMEPPSDDVIDT